MPTKFRYQFTCGHAANATNEESMRLIKANGQSHRFCPKCFDRVCKQIERCITTGTRPRKNAVQPLPEIEG